MGDFVLRKYIREILSEYYNNTWVYTAGPNKFPYLDGTNKTPADLSDEFKQEFGKHSDEISEESEEIVGLKKTEKKSKKKSNFSDKH